MTAVFDRDRCPTSRLQPTHRQLSLRHQPTRSVLVASVVLLLAVPTEPRAAQSDPAATCIYMVHHGGAQYALPYAGRRCGRDGYLTLPLDQYDALASWSKNAELSGIISLFDRYRILARLATLDERSEQGSYGIHGLFTRWSEYKWAEHTTSAYARLDALGNVKIVANSIERPLLRLGLATKRDTTIRIKQREISASERADLLSLLATAEAELAKVDRFHAVPRSLEEAAHTDVPRFTESHRRALSVFRLD